MNKIRDSEGKPVLLDKINSCSHTLDSLINYVSSAQIKEEKLIERVEQQKKLIFNLKK